MNPKLMTAALALATAIMLEPSAADAAPYWPWCSRYFPGEIHSCAFASWEQCMDTVRGIGGFCYANPYPNPHTPTAGRTVKPRRHAAR
jgi:hypothetical protein